MLFVEKRTASFVNFPGYCHQTQYSIFQCEFQLWELKKSVGGRFGEYRVCGTCDVLYEKVASNS